MPEWIEKLEAMTEKVQSYFQSQLQSYKMRRDLRRNENILVDGPSFRISYRKDGKIVPVGAYDPQEGTLVLEPSHDVATSIGIVETKEYAMDIAHRNNVMVKLQ